MDEMYREIILDHYKNPRNFGKLISFDIHKKDSNPLCGDVVEIFLKLDKEKIKNIGFEGKGCAICMASASIFCEEMEGKSLEFVKNFSREDMLDLVGVNLTASRVKCAMLPLVCTKKGIIDFEVKK
ncbi:MAG: Fe-S cluster assembly sulfur transfer protein SufU [Candidatus Woesearchaeota archaeon]